MVCDGIHKIDIAARYYLPMAVLSASTTLTQGGSCVPFGRYQSDIKPVSSLASADLMRCHYGIWLVTVAAKWALLLGI